MGVYKPTPTGPEAVLDKGRERKERATGISEIVT
jgi:hypothetical protein